jgi:hypothetical protein
VTSASEESDTLGAEMPEWVAESIQRAQHDGVYFKRSRPSNGGGMIPFIGWHPGDQNALAEAIASHVTQRSELDIDGKKYWIEPQ